MGSRPSARSCDHEGQDILFVVTGASGAVKSAVLPSLRESQSCVP
jgi:hypothetical protein